MGLFGFMKNKDKKSDMKEVKENVSEFKQEINNDNNMFANNTLKESTMDIENVFKLDQFNKEFGQSYSKVKSYIMYDQMGINTGEIDQLLEVFNNLPVEGKEKVEPSDFLLPYLYEKELRNIIVKDEIQTLSSAKIRLGNNYPNILLNLYIAISKVVNKNDIEDDILKHCREFAMEDKNE